MSIQNQNQEEEKHSFLVTKTVEYLEPLMSKELLCKFPDTSLFTFDYSQSSIWSPLAQTNYPFAITTTTPKKLKFQEFGVEEKKSTKQNKKRKNSECSSSGFIGLLKSKKMKKLKRVSGFSPTPTKIGCLPITNKGWNKVLKAASKHFKRIKKKDPAALHVKLSDYLKGPDY